MFQLSPALGRGVGATSLGRCFRCRRGKRGFDAAIISLAAAMEVDREKQRLKACA